MRLRIDGVSRHRSAPLDYYMERAKSEAPWIVAVAAIFLSAYLSYALIRSRHEIRCLEGETELCP